MKMRSKRFRDQPEKPLNRAVWWIEYVLRHPNPEHLRSPVLKQGSFVSNLFDIILVFAVFIVLMVFVLWGLLIKLLKVFHGCKANQIKKNI